MFVELKLSLMKMTGIYVEKATKMFLLNVRFCIINFEFFLFYLLEINTNDDACVVKLLLVLL